MSSLRGMAIRWFGRAARLGAGLAVAAAMGLGLGVASGETSSWEQRIDPAPKARPAPTAKQPSKVKSQPVGSKDGPAARLPTTMGKVASPLGPSLGPSTIPDGSVAKAGTDPAYDAFEQGKYLTALALALDLAKTGDVPAHTLVGRIHAEGLGVAKDAATAAKWYARAAELGDVEAAVGLGAMFATGTGVEKDHAQAARYFEKAAATGHAVASYNLALLFLSGKGKPENPQRGFGLMGYAAEKGVTAAQYDLGTLYATGTGTEPNAFEAAKWFARAANRGHGEAEVEFASILLKKHDLSPEEAAKIQKRGFALLQSAASKGMPVALNRLARCYANGVGVAADQLEAAKWHIIAKSVGVEDEALDKLVAKLSRADKAKAEKAAGEWRDRVLLE